LNERLARDRYPTARGEFRIRKAEPSDVAVVLGFIRELAEYEKSVHKVSATEPLLREALFGPVPRAEALLGTLGSDPVAFAVFYYTFSTYLGRHGIHLEDLYVRPEHRGAGLGRHLLSHLAGLARERGCARLEWCALSWNEPAHRFYDRLGATRMEEIRCFRLEGEALDDVAGRD
jgi:GNAT superfamily N-acetyltransferase